MIFAWMKAWRMNLKFFLSFLGFWMVERCEWEKVRFCENNFDMTCCWDRRTGNGTEITMGRCNVRCFALFSTMNWRELVEWNEVIWSFCACLQRVNVCLWVSLNDYLQGGWGSANEEWAENWSFYHRSTSRVDCVKTEFSWMFERYFAELQTGCSDEVVPLFVWEDQIGVFHKYSWIIR